MANIHYITTGVLLKWMRTQLAMQVEMVRLQEEVIALQKRIDEMTPKMVDSKDVLWHVATGTQAKDAAASEDPAVVERLLKWNEAFAVKHIKPYVNPKVFMECLHQMTRGLPERVVHLKEKREQSKKETNVPPQQMSFVQ